MIYEYDTSIYNYITLNLNYIFDVVKIYISYISYENVKSNKLFTYTRYKNYFPISLFLHFSLNSNTNFPFALTSHDSRIQQYYLPIQLKLKLNFVL